MNIMKYFLLFLFAVCPISFLTNTKEVFAQSPSADIVIMIDLTGSTSLQDLELEKNASRTLLQSFINLPNRPRVAVGTFNETNGNSLNPARILAGGELTQNYTQLNQVISGINSTGGFTDVAAAISVAQAHLEISALSSNRFIIFISDGTPNRPGRGGYEACDNCGCDDAYAASRIARELAESHGTRVFGVYYEGSGNNFCGFAGEPARGQAFMRNDIATDASYFYLGNADLSGVFNKISCSISCDDSNSCTQDSCDEITNTCRHDPITSDTDGDGVIDCQDQCRGVDALLNTPCNDPLGCGSGSYACNKQGNVACQLSESSAQACFNCTNIDQAPVLGSVSAAFGSQKATVDKFYKSVSKLSKKNKKIKKEIKGIRLEARALLATSILSVQSVPSVFAQCSNQQRCTDVYESARIDNLSKSLSRFKALSDKLYSRLRKLTKNITKADRTLRKNAIKIYNAGKSAIAAIPQTRSECS